MARKNEIINVNEVHLQSTEEIEDLIIEVRGKQVMLDRDLARLYGVDTKRLNQQVQRNIERFPEDFMFQLTKEEFESLRSQFATSNVNKTDLTSQNATSNKRGGQRYMPYDINVDIAKHNTQYEPIEVEHFDRAHDRFLCIDDTVYHIGASLKDLGKKWFAFSKMEMTTDELLRKI